MSRRRVLGDETWRLACMGDASALHRVATLLADPGSGARSYESHRARAFAFAVVGDVEAALEELHSGREDDWPFPAAFAADTARVRLLAGNYEDSLGALRVAVRGARRLDPEVAQVVVAVARSAPALRVGAVRVALAGGTPWQRIRTALAAASARA